MIGIYKLTSPNNKSYVGQSINVEWRLNSYKNLRCKQQVKIYNALLKYGWKNFTVEYLEIITDISDDLLIRNKLNELEVYYINKYDCVNNGYNIRHGGLNGGLSQSSRDKISKANKGKVFSIEHLKKLSESHKGYIMPEEQRRKIGVRSKEIGISSKTRLKMVESRRGYRPTKDTLEKSSKSHIRKSVLQYDLNGNFIKEWECAVYANKELNIVLSMIYGCCLNNGINRTAGGFMWKYKNGNKIPHKIVNEYAEFRKSRPKCCKCNSFVRYRDAILQKKDKYVCRKCKRLQTSILLGS